MIRAMFSAISGLRNHQTMMDVVGNNIANVNTFGYKSSGVVFQDVLSQTIRGAGAGSAALGGTNPAQVGLGAKIGAITTNYSQGALQRTGRATDFAIQGDGFFMVAAGQSVNYTRSGTFSVDSTGALVTQDGSYVQGWQANQNGVVNTNASIGSTRIPVGDLVAPVTTANIVVGGNLPADQPIGTAISTSVNIYDSQGTAIPVNFTYTKSAADTWGVTATYGTPGTAFTVTGGPLTFDTAGELTSGYSLGIAAGQIPNVGAVTVGLGAAAQSGRLTQFSGNSSAAVISQDGSSAGSLQGFTVSQDGMIVGSYSNGRTKNIAQLALATFNNPEGLEKAGGSNFRATVNSGLATAGVPGVGGRGLLSSGTLEMSNVDLAQEFTSLIVAQRGFQANSRVVTSADDILQEIVNLKR